VNDTQGNELANIVFNITVTPANDAPTLDTSLTPTLPSLTTNDTNPSGILVTALLNGAITDPDPGAVEGMAVIAASNQHGTWEYSLNGTTWLPMNEPTSSAALLLPPKNTRVRFIPRFDFNGTEPISYRAWDQTVGTAGGTLDTFGNIGGDNTLSMEVESATITITQGENAAPVLDASLNPSVGSIKEDTASPFGKFVSALIEGAVTDANPGALRGIAVTGAPGTNGTWQYRLSGGVWKPMGAVSESTARLLPASAKVRFIPKPNYHGTVLLTYRAWDRTQGTIAGTFNTTGNTGGTKSLSSGSESATLTVTPVNDKPVLTLSGTIGYVHDKPPITLAPGAGVQDVDSANFGGGRLRVRITDGASSTNRLSIGFGFTVDANSNVLQAGIVIGKLVSNGFGSKELIVTFNNKATVAIVQSLVRAITFKTVGGLPGARKVVFTVSDGDGGISAEAFKTVNVT
jgi:hypothetical protein